jgi:hypothetical protein
MTNVCYIEVLPQWTLQYPLQDQCRIRVKAKARQLLQPSHHHYRYGRVAHFIQTSRPGGNTEGTHVKHARPRPGGGIGQVHASVDLSLKKVPLLLIEYIYYYYYNYSYSLALEQLKLHTLRMRRQHLDALFFYSSLPWF